MRESKEKIYHCLLDVQKKYHSFDELIFFVTYLPYQGLRLNVCHEKFVRKNSWMNNAKEISVCLDKMNMFELAEHIAWQIEEWIKQNHFK